MNVLSLLKNSICFPALAISCSTYDEQFMRKHPDFIANMKQYQHNRYVQILRAANQDAGPRDPIYTG